MMKKRIVAMMLTVGLILGCLAGCSQKNPESQSTSESKSQQETASQQTSSSVSEETQETALEEKTIQIMYAGSKQKDSEMVWAEFNELLQQYVPNTTVEFIPVVNAEYKERFSQVLAAEEKIDLVWTGYIINDKNMHIKDGNFIALDDLLAEYGQGIVETLGQQVVEIHKNEEDGKLYIIPCWQGLYGNKLSWLVLDEIAELAGNTWMEDTQKALTKWRENCSGVEDFQAVLDQATKYLAAAKEAGKLGAGPNLSRLFGWNMTSTASQFAIFHQIGLNWFDDTFTAVDLQHNEYVEAYYETVSKWYEAGFIRSDIMSVDLKSMSLPKDGNITENTWIMSTEANLLPGDDATWTASCGMDVTLLTIESEGYFQNGSATCYSIPYCADAPERAMMVLDVLYTQKDLYNLFVYGIEGVHYTVNNDGTINTEYTAASPKADHAYGVARWMMGSCKNALVNNGTDPNYYSDLEKAEKTARINPFMNFSFDNTNVADIVASVEAIFEEYNKALFWGAYGSDWKTKYDDINKIRYDAGYQKVIDEYQAQLDTYIEKHNITSW